MQEETIIAVWSDEINHSILKSNILFIALFSTDKELLYTNKAMSLLLTNEPYQSLINPTFDKLLLLDNTTPLIFDGFLTLGDYDSINASIYAQIFRKGDKLLILGGVDAKQLIEQNKTMHSLNRDLSNLQRELIKEKHSLEITLNKLNKTNVDLEKLNTNKDLFISILAHDLKSPFQSILGFLDLLTEGFETYSVEETKTQLSYIYSSAESTYNLLEDLLLWTRAESGKITYAPQKQNLAEVLTNVIDSLELNANNKNITIKHAIAEDIFVFADINMIKLVFRNLISNAIKFTQGGGLISVSATQSQSDVTITVADNGLGIKPEILPKLFDIAHKITTKGTDKEKGTGLGLLLCKEFVEINGGRIWVESELGKGSDFKFILKSYTSDMSTPAI